VKKSLKSEQGAVMQRLALVASLAILCNLETPLTAS
jgi:hypothetical protein